MVTFTCISHFIYCSTKTRKGSTVLNLITKGKCFSDKMVLFIFNIIILMIFLLPNMMYADSRLDALIGAYRGTYSTDEGQNALEILAFKNGNEYKAMIYLFPENTLSPRQTLSSYPANIKFDTTANMYEITSSSINLLGALRERTISGRASGSASWSFTATRTTNPQNRYTGPHTCFDIGNSQVDVSARCDREGSRIFGCIFCRNETRRESIPRLAHTPTNRWEEENKADCVNSGSEIMKCKICGGIASRRQTNGDHTPNGKWEVKRNSNCSESGLMVQYCSICNREAITNVIPIIPDAHKLITTRTRGSWFLPPIYTAQKCELPECHYVASEHLDIPATILSFLIIIIIAIVCILGYLKALKVYKENTKVKEVMYCPFCFEEIKKNEIVTDENNGEKKLLCPECKDDDTITIKSNTGIPEELLKIPHLPFSIVGISKAGKTHYITTLLDELGAGNNQIDISVRHLNDDTKAHQLKNRTILYKHRITLESTTSLETAQIWRITNNYRKRGTYCPSYAFTIYDGAGEKLVNNFAQESRYIKASKALILVVSATELKDYIKRGVITKEDLAKANGGSADADIDITEVMENIAQYLRKIYQLPQDKTLHYPVAVVLTKIDLLFEEFDKNSWIRNNDRSIVSPNGKIYMQGVDAIGEELKKCLFGDDKGKAFLKHLKSIFHNYKLFGVSSLNQNPTDILDKVKYEAQTYEGYLLSDELKPHRVLDPLLWILHEKKFID